jgi:hypothetical protein
MAYLQLGLISVNMDLVKWIYFGLAATTDSPNEAVDEPGSVPRATLHFIDGSQREFDLPEHLDAIRRYLQASNES